MINSKEEFEIYLHSKNLNDYLLNTNTIWRTNIQPFYKTIYNYCDTIHNIKSYTSMEK